MEGKYGSSSCLPVMSHLYSRKGKAEMRVLCSTTTLWPDLSHGSNQKNQFLVSNQTELQHKSKFSLRVQWSFGQETENSSTHEQRVKGRGNSLRLPWLLG